MKVETRYEAPWRDFKGNRLFLGDKIQHPGGEIGRIVYDTNKKHTANAWLVDYGKGEILSLCLQIGEKGQAVKINK